MINRQDERGELANGCYVVEFAPAHPDGSLPSEAEWTRVGRMTLQTALTTNIDRGTNLEIRDICNALLQSQGEEPTISYDMGFVDIPRAALEFFADATVTGTGDTTHIAVHSYRATKNYAVRFYSPGRLGSWVATYPNTSVALDPATWTRENGYESAAHVTVLAVSMDDATHGMEHLTLVTSDTGMPGPIPTPANPIIAQAGETVNVTFDKTLTSLVATPVAAWLTISGSGNAWTLEATANVTGEDRIANLVATATDGSISNFTVTQPSAGA